MTENVSLRNLFNIRKLKKLGTSEQKENLRIVDRKESGKVILTRTGQVDTDGMTF